MNSSIRALAHDAGLYVDLGHTLYPRAMSAEECEAAYAKFAESLIRECAKVCKAQSTYDPIVLPYKPSEQFEKAIREHFGVEE